MPKQMTQAHMAPNVQKHIEKFVGDTLDYILWEGEEKYTENTSLSDLRDDCRSEGITARAVANVDRAALRLKMQPFLDEAIDCAMSYLEFALENEE
jgi:hypothetical protein